jgi:enoyl-CoA hydratase/carnithine racemase
MAPETLTYSVTERIARITLDRPERGNGITRLLATELEQCVEQADLDPTVHVILLSGNGKGDGVARHTPEGYEFQRQAMQDGFREAVRARDEPFGDRGSSTFKG